MITSAIRRLRAASVLLAVALVVFVLGPAPFEETALAQGSVPTLSSAMMRGAVNVSMGTHVLVTLVYDQDLDTAKLPPTSAFTLTRKYSGQSESRGDLVPASVNSPTAREIQLRFPRLSNDVPFFSYNPGTSQPLVYELTYVVPSNDDQKIQSSTGEAAEAFSGQSVGRENLTATFSGAPSSWTLVPGSLTIGQSFDITLTLSEPVLSEDGISVGRTSHSIYNAQVVIKSTNADRTVFTLTVTPRGNLWEGVDVVISTRIPAHSDCRFFVKRMCTVDYRPLSENASVRISAPSTLPTSDSFGIRMSLEEIYLNAGYSGISKRVPHPSGGIWSNGTTIWVTSKSSDLNSNTLHAFTIAEGDEYGRYDSSKNIGISPGISSGIWSDDTTMYVAYSPTYTTRPKSQIADRSGDNEIQAFRLSDGSRDLSKQIELHDDNDLPEGIWSDGTTIWVVDTQKDDQNPDGNPKMFAYRMSDGTRDSSKEFNLNSENKFPGGIWANSNGTTIWVADSREDRLFAYTLSTGASDTSNEITLSGLNANPWGIWSNGTKMWVADNTGTNWVDYKLFAYNMTRSNGVGGL